jgi:hypothetical protein
VKTSATLGFRRIVCRSCGERRIVGVTCPTCGENPDPREADPDRQGRRRLARSALEALDADLPPVDAEQPSLTPAVWTRVQAVFEDLLKSLMEAIGDQAKAPGLMRGIGAFRQLEAEVASTPRLRPWIDLGAAVDEVLANLKSVVRHYLLGSGAEMPLEAQREAQVAQQELDGAAGPVTALSERTEAWARVEAADTIEDAVAVLAANAFDRSNARNLVEFDQAGWAAYERVTGEAARLPGYGIGLNLIVESARGPFDESRVWQVAQRTFSLLTNDPVWLAGLVSDAAWRTDNRAALEKLWDAGRLQTATLAAVRHDREAVRVMLDAGQDLVESAGKRYVATLIAATKNKAYVRYRNQSSGNLLVSANDMGLQDLIRGLDRAIRTASAHDEFSLEGEVVVLMDRGTEVERLRVELLADRVLTGMETTIALGLGVLCAGVHGGIEIDQLVPDIAGLGVAPEEVLAWIMTSSGWRDVRVEPDQETLTLSGAAERAALTMPHVAALIPHIPEGFEQVIVVAESPDGRHELRGPAVAFREFQACQDELEKQVLNVVLLRRWRRESAPLMSQEQGRKVLAVLTLKSAASGDRRDTMRRLRVLRDGARALEDTELTGAIADLMAALRNAYVGLTDAGLRAATDRITGWASLQVEPLDVVLTGTGSLAHK